MAESKIKNPNSIDTVSIIPIAGKVDSDFNGVIYRCGRSCFLSIGDGKVTAGADEPFGTVPVGYRPVRIVDFLDTYGKLRLQVFEGGQIQCRSALNDTVIRGSTMYLAY